MKNISILTNTNLEPLAKKLKSTGFKNVYHCPYNHHLLDLINPDSGLYKQPPDILFIYLDAEEFFNKEFAELPSFEPFQKKLSEYYQPLEAYAQRFPQTIILFSLFIFPPFTFANYINGKKSETFKAIAQKLNNTISSYEKNIANIYAFDLDRLFTLHGYNTMIDEKYWYLTRFKFSAQGLETLTQEIMQMINAITGKSKKVLVLDLDNVLWSGILGEDGIDGVELSEDGVGKIYRDFQRAVKSLKEIGVILAINSKNNETDAQKMFSEHPMMALAWDDFAAKEINWDNKAQNMHTLANKLNLGLDSFVFIDDNPVERGLIKEQCPQVTVPDFPEDVAYLKKWLLNDIVYPYFGKTSLTKEDRDKTEQYARNAKRQELSQKIDISAYLKQLNIKLTIHKNPANLKTRLAQLTQKTNQFNMTTHRYSEAEMDSFITRGDYVVYALEYEDTFGKEGIIGAAIVNIAKKEAALLNTFLMSCRVIGREVEQQFLQEILDDLQKNGIISLNAEFIPTDKNAIASGFFAAFGFEETKQYQYRISTKEFNRYNKAAVITHG